MTQVGRFDEAPFLFIVSMDVSAEHEGLFNEVYDTEHLPAITRVPGVLGARRYERLRYQSPVSGASLRETPSQSQPRYHAVYGLASADVLSDPEWTKAVDLGRWPAEVRPHTTNRQHLLTRRMPAQGAGS